ncbi:hypothetical protein P43SY_001465 [Pythium insidiosum]|uniref:Uncharacterized protein n=1 Tax=Pythium insidiosum TaxID=114742 RepID=A0AAD5Q832_PYTIN|nr:hypothetical protein P43SY_001465 [Pythium insidiosum]
MRPLALVTACVVAAAMASSAVEATRNGVNCRVLKNPIKMATRQCICQPCHICEFKFDWRNSGCQLIRSHNPDVTDGSERPSDTPTLDPQAWFLSEAELTASRAGAFD